MKGEFSMPMLMNPYLQMDLASGSQANVTYKPMVKSKRPDDDVH